MRKGEKARDQVVKDVNGQIFRDGVEVRMGWEKYFERVLNVENVRVANINGWRLAPASVRRIE